MNYGSVCSGIEAATVAWHPLGMKPAFFAETDKFPSAVLRHHYSDTPNAGDFTKIQENDYDAIDLLVAGTPCQDFSVAGLRAGMAGKRGQLTVEFAHLAGRLRPRWLVWENVPGVLSIDEGRAFGTFIGILGKLGYGIAYRVLDAQHFGVPQRRRRVFVVGHLGDWRRAAAVLFERHSLSGHPAPSREKGQGFTRGIAVGPSGGEFTETSCTLDSRAKDEAIRNQLGMLVASTGDISHCLNAGGMGRQDYETETMIVTAPLTRNHYADNESRESLLVTTLMPVIGLDQEFNASEDQLGTLKVGGRGGFCPPTVAFTCKDHGADASVTSPTLRAMGHDGSHANAGGQVAVAISANQRGELRERSVHASLNGTKSGKQFDGVMTGMSVRRLTPRECERLQGFPDDYTLVKYRKVLKSGSLSKREYLAADGPRYKALGNSMAVPVMRWIGERIQQVEAIDV